MITAESARFLLFFHQKSLILSVLANVSLLSKHGERRQDSSKLFPLVPMALTIFVLPVGREVRLQYALAERMI